MRASPHREYRGLLNELRAVNPRAPVFRAEVEPLYWVNYVTNQREQKVEGPAAAFCGLGNPASFWTTLKTLAIQPAFQWAFGDHHRYTYQQLGRLAAEACSLGSSVLLTTEKDSMNLPEGAADVSIARRSAPVLAKDRSARNK